jgi:hypothetical protein
MNPATNCLNYGTALRRSDLYILKVRGLNLGWGINYLFEASHYFP